MVQNYPRDARVLLVPGNDEMIPEE